MQVRSAVIPAAGMGTRFLPATKAVPKELFPIGDDPTLQLVIDEALGAGIDHIVVVSSRDKPAIEAYFRRDDALIGELEDKGKTELADRLAAIGRDWRATIVYQDQPQGLGHAVGCAREAVGDEPFAVLLPDELMGVSSLLAQMNGVCASTGGSVVAVVNVPREQVSSYGVIDPAGERSRRRGDPGARPGREAVGRGCAEQLRHHRPLRADPRRCRARSPRLQPGRGGEIQLTDALRAQAARSPFHAVVIVARPPRHRDAARLPDVVDRARPAAPRLRRAEVLAAVPDDLAGVAD